MTDPPPGKHMLRPGDLVWTPLHRKAKLVRYRPDCHWDARYIGPHAHGEPTILNPAQVIPV